MGIFAMTVLAFGMAMDAFAAALARGAALPVQLRLPCLLRTALVFGVIETVMPLLGFALGNMAGEVISEWDHWVAFILLMILGGKMVYGACFAERDGLPENTINQAVQQGRVMLVVTAFATSIDSLIVGVGLAFLAVNIWYTALMIGAATTMMAALGLRLGRFLGTQIGKRAEAVGGLILIGIGCWVLLTHLGYLD